MRVLSEARESRWPSRCILQRISWCGLILGCWLAVSTWSPTLVAQDSAAAANALFNEAKQLGRDGQWAAACPKFKSSYELDKQLGTLLNLADCYDNIGKVATAWAHWSDALEWAKRDGAEKRIEFAEARLKQTEAQLPKLTVRVSNPLPGLTIRQGQVVVDRAMWGSAIPVDPGPLEVSVSRGERVLVTRKIEARATEVIVVEFDLADIDREFPAVADPWPTGVSPSPSPLPLPSTPAEPYDATHRNVGLVVGAIGLAGVLAAAGLEIGALVKQGQAEQPDACVNKFCSQAGLDDAETAATFAEVGQWVGIGGLVVLAVGATIFFTAPSEAEPSLASGARVTPWFASEAGGLSVEGRF